MGKDNKKMSLKKWLEYSGLENIINNEEIETSEEISLDEFYDTQIKGRFIKTMSSKTENFLKENFPSIIKEWYNDNIGMYMDHMEMSARHWLTIPRVKDMDEKYANMDDEEFTDMTTSMMKDDLEMFANEKKEFERALNGLREVAGEDIEQVNEMVQQYEDVKDSINIINIIPQEMKHNFYKTVKVIGKNVKNEQEKYGTHKKENQEQEMRDKLKGSVIEKRWILDENKTKNEKNVNILSAKQLNEDVEVKPISKPIQTGDILKAIGDLPLGGAIGKPIKEQSITVVSEKISFFQKIKNAFKERFPNTSAKIAEIFKPKEVDRGEPKIPQGFRNYLDDEEPKQYPYEEEKKQYNSFINSITKNGELQSKNQQKKNFEIVKKWSEQNIEQIKQEEKEQEMN